MAPTSAVLTQSSGSIETVRDGRRWPRHSYNSRRGDNNYGYSRRGYNSYGYRSRNRGFYGPGLAFGLGLGLGSSFGYGYGYPYYSRPYYAPRYTTYNYYQGGGAGWKEACARRYRSFDWRTGTFLGYDGRRHLCRL